MGVDFDWISDSIQALFMLKHHRLFDIFTVDVGNSEPLVTIFGHTEKLTLIECQDLDLLFGRKKIVLN
jgi:hypothetical protein